MNFITEEKERAYLDSVCFLDCVKDLQYTLFCYKGAGLTLTARQTFDAWPNTGYLSVSL